CRIPATAQAPGRYPPARTGTHGSPRAALPARSCAARSERRRLEIAAPLLAQRAADLAQGRLGTRRVQHGPDHVLPGPGRGQHRRQRRVDRRLVALPPPPGQNARLRLLDLVAAPKDLHRLLDRVGVGVHAHDALVALLQLLLVGEGGLGDLGHEPAILDAAQDPAGHRVIRADRADRGKGLLGLGLQPVRERLQVPGAAGGPSWAPPAPSMTPCWVRSGIPAASPLGSAGPSSSALVGSELVPPSTAASASTAVRTTLLSGCCAVSETPAVWVWNRSHWARSAAAP